MPRKKIVRNLIEDPDFICVPLEKEKERRENLLAIGSIDICTGLFGRDFINDPDVVKTPERFRKYLLSFCQPFNARELLAATFVHQDKTNDYPTLVTQHNISFRAMCMHHLLPFIGTASVGYIPRNKVVGLSKLARLIQSHGTAKPNIQEAITEAVVDDLMEHVEAAGAICVLKCTHMCMACRGVLEPNAVTVTAAIRGVFRDVPAAREEFYSLMKVV